MTRGKLVTFEGAEGVGKSTQLRLLQQYLTDTQQTAVFLREPGGTTVGEYVRAILLDKANSNMSPYCETLLYAASRAQLVDEKIVPALDSGLNVFCDRYVHSSIAYQGYARELGESFVRTANSHAFELAAPDVVIFLRLSPSEGFARKGGADSTRLEQESSDFFSRVYQGLCKIADEGRDNFYTIVPSGTKYDTHNQVIELLRKLEIIR